MPDPVPTFNLWAEPWITLERSDGGRERLGIEQTLLQAHDYTAIYEPSPLVVVGIHRLLVAILQAVLDPRKPPDLLTLWQAGQFPQAPICAFGGRYADRFDLFSASAPFLQSADLPLRPAKGERKKSVGYLAPEVPTGTEITHYRHGSEDVQAFCPACLAGSLAAIPAFATSGGAGIKPSINGVPPIYILPGGESLFESLAASLVLPNYQPEVRSKTSDAAWWMRTPIVEHSKEVYDVGYLHSLTFPARRVRLYPERLQIACTRCGEFTEWGVRTMVFDMGESRPKEPFWFDPFAAYRLPSGKGKDLPTPIRPQAGRALWREFASLFLQQPETTGGSKNRTLRPRVLDQIANLGIGSDFDTYPFRCIGMRTDMKAKIFEWIDAGFDIPPVLLRDPQAGIVVDGAIRFATECSKIITSVFQEVFSRKLKNAERHQGLKNRMQDQYWSALAGPFRQFVLDLASSEEREAVRRRWLDIVVRKARRAFQRAADAIGDDGASLRDRVRGERLCGIRLEQKRKEYLPDE